MNLRLRYIASLSNWCPNVFFFELLVAFIIMHLNIRMVHNLVSIVVVKSLGSLYNWRSDITRCLYLRSNDWSSIVIRGIVSCWVV